MNVAGRPMRTIWLAADGQAVEIIDQTRLPHELVVARLARLDEAARAIRDMQVRGAPLIGATAAYGMALAMAEDASDTAIEDAAATLVATRPTAANLAWALAEMRRALAELPPAQRHAAALARAAAIADEDVAINRAIGQHGLGLIEAAFERKARRGPVQILTHCNAGWLATVDWGTAIAPIYRAHDAGIPLHVWVDETRPRNQGASLTAWELGQHGVPHTVIADNAGGHLMRQGQVDLCIVGTDRTTAGGDVANKIGTYLKALAAHDNGVPFYVALPSPTIDWTIEDGAAIPIEQRDPREVTHIAGWTEAGERVEVRLTPADSPAANFAFDVTPARLVTALITERGVCPASRAGLLGLFPERRERGAARQYGAEPMTNWSETYRGTVPPWECDVTEHFTIAFYFDRLTEAERNLAELLDLGDLLRGAGFHRRFNVRFARELRAGSSFHIEGAALAVNGEAGGELRLGHRFVDSADGAPVTWIEERWDLSGVPLSPARHNAIAARLAAWEGPALEERAEPPSDAGFIPTARGRVKPGDVDADGHFGLAAIVHRFTDACIQASAAIGMNAEFLANERRGLSTFELALRLSGALSLDEPYLVETGVAHLGNSSVRFVHRMSDPRNGLEVARLGQYAVNLDLDARRSAKWPDDIRARAQGLLIPVG